MRVLIFAWLLVGLTAIMGWIMNIIALAAMTNPLDSTVGVLRIVGIFVPPLGTIMGLFV